MWKKGEISIRKAAKIFLFMKLPPLKYNTGRMRFQTALAGIPAGGDRFGLQRKIGKNGFKRCGRVCPETAEHQPFHRPVPAVPRRAESHTCIDAFPFLHLPPFLRISRKTLSPEKLPLPLLLYFHGPDRPDPEKPIGPGRL